MVFFWIDVIVRHISETEESGFVRIPSLLPNYYETTAGLSIDYMLTIFFFFYGKYDVTDFPKWMRNKLAFYEDYL